MDYMPVNVLQRAGEPVYDTFTLLSSLAVPASMWDMTVPQGFTMGALPAKP
jgi:hypothetical protein